MNLNETVERGVDGFNNGILRDPKTLSTKAAEVAAALSAQQREFCHAMMTAESATAAAIAAGYSPKTSNVKASQLLTNPGIIEYLGILMLLRAQAVSIDAAQIISMQLNTYYIALEKENLKEANIALDQLAKMGGLYNRVSTKIPSPKELKHQSRAEQIDEIEEMTKILEQAASRKKINDE